MKNLAMMFKTLSDESRLRIYNILLASGELCVCAISSRLFILHKRRSRVISPI